MSDSGRIPKEHWGHGTPDDWLGRNVYSRYVVLGLTLTGTADVLLFGIVPGALIFLTQIVWIPFWAAGVINGIGHFWGYRNWSTGDASTNIVPWGILIGGEELHNNHHAFATSARLSNKWYEFDYGAVEALDGIQGGAGAPAAGVVPARRGERRPPPGGVFAAAAVLRLNVR